MAIKLNTKEFRGVLSLNYKVEYNTNDNKVVLHLITEKLNGDKNALDCIVKEEGTYEESLCEALKEAKNRWGIQLYKNELEKVA